MRLHSSGAEHAIVAAISAWRPALEGALARGFCQTTTNVATTTPKRRSSGECWTILKAAFAMRIAYYFEPIMTTFTALDDQGVLIDLHERTFRSNGWEPVRLSEQTSRRHPLYEFFSRRDTILARTKNEWSYARACYMRWLAYAVEGIPFCDFDVLNYGFTPEDAAELMAEAKAPLLISNAGAVGLLRSSDYKSVINLFVDFVKNPVLRGRLKTEDINDMTILQELSPGWFTQVPFEDRRFAKDYSTEGWREAKLVHYPYHYTPVPRGRTAVQARLPEELKVAQVIEEELARLGCRSMLDLSCDRGMQANDLFTLGYAGTVMSLASAAENRRSVGKTLDSNPAWIMLPQPGAWDVQDGSHLAIEELIDILAGRGLTESLRASFDSVVIGSRFLKARNLDRLLESLPSLKVVGIVRGKMDGKEEAEVLVPPSWLDAHAFHEVAAVHSAGLRLYERHTGARAIPVQKEPFSIGSVVTSLGPTPRRISATKMDFGEHWLKHCAASWRMTAPVVRSVSEIAPSLSGIEWAKVEAKPKIAELIAAIPPDNKKPVLLVNADIVITQSLRDLQHSLCDSVLYYGRRVDVVAPREPKAKYTALGYYHWGFDYFILPPEFVRSVNLEKSLPDFFRIGEPWWDYAIPILALASGFPVKRLAIRKPAALHLKHPIVSNQYLKQTGVKFIAWLRTLDTSRSTVLSDILPYWLQEEKLVEINGGFSRLAAAILEDMP